MLTAKMIKLLVILGGLAALAAPRCHGNPKSIPTISSHPIQSCFRSPRPKKVTPLRLEKCALMASSRFLTPSCVLERNCYPVATRFHSVPMERLVEPR